MTTTQVALGPVMGNWGSATTYYAPRRCPVGSYATGAQWRENDWLQSFQLFCSPTGVTDNMPPARDSGWPITINAPAGGWNQWVVAVGNGVTKVNNRYFGSDNSNPRNWYAAYNNTQRDQYLTCPANQKVVGYHGRYSDQVDALGPVCDYTAEYCKTDLEHKFCKENKSVVTDDILNEACSAKITDTCTNNANRLQLSTLNKVCSKEMPSLCRDNLSKLSPSVVSDYCVAHPNDNLCSCLEVPPSYIPPEMHGLPQCWNQKCATLGYKFGSTAVQCPVKKVCRQDLSTEDQNNIVTSNFQLQDCSDGLPADADRSKPTPPASGSGSVGGSTGGSTGGSGVVTQAAAAITAQQAADAAEEKKTQTMYMIGGGALLLLIIIVVLLTSGGSSDDEYYDRRNRRRSGRRSRRNEFSGESGNV